ncbi:hypothetical protein FQA39_LY10115 [Lamprigera yunnana]|nr:hypothetical protein FQA39_LY10115 [Lamprigera yunnana]
MDVSKKISRKLNPIDRSGVLSKLAFAFVWGTFKKGFKNDFKDKDLYEICKSCEATSLGNRIQREWETEKKKHNPSLLKVIFRMFGKVYIIMGILYFILGTSGSLLKPRLKGKLVSYFSPNQTALSEVDAYYYGVSLVGFSLLYTLLLHYYFFILEQIGLKIKIALASLIYKKSLKLSSVTMSQKGTGDVVTLITKDLNTLEGACHTGNHLWVGSIQVFILTYMMYEEIHISALIGTLIIILSMPIQALIGRYLAVFRRRTGEKTDRRVRTTQEMLTALRVIKMYTWELFFEDTITTQRNEEIRDWRILSYLKITAHALGGLITKASLYVAIITFTVMGNHVTAENAFVVTGCFAILNPIVTHFIPASIGCLSESYASLRRIRNFLVLEEIKQTFQVEKIKAQEPIILVKEINVKYENYILRNINLSITPGLTVITGVVGAGKSTLLKLVFGDVNNVDGVVQVAGRVSYSSQEPWLFPSTIKQNIIFNEKFDEDRYRNVIQACDLEKDLFVLPEGDQTRVIDKGLNLSRGQKMRINLARAVYKVADIYLLDDCLSAVDDHVGKHIFQHCFKKFLHNKICIFVTYKEEFISKSDDIILLKDGVVLFHGNYEGLITCNDYTSEYVGVTDEEINNEPTIIVKKGNGKNDDLFGNEYEESKLLPRVAQNIYAEFTNEGTVKKEVYFAYFKSAGGIKVFIIVVVAAIIAQAIFSWSDYFVSDWVDIEQQMSSNRVNSTTDSEIYKKLEDSRNNILTRYSLITASLFFIAIFKTGCFIYFFSEAAKNIHKMVLRSIMKAYMPFFDINLSGNILNRLSRDLAILDETMPIIVFEVISIIIFLVSILFVISTVNAIFLIPSAVLLAVLVLARWLYISTSRSFRRLEGATRSPLIGQFNATLEGLSTIRASEAEHILEKEFDNHQNLYNSAVFTNISISRALGFYLDFISSVYIAAIVLSFLIFQIESLAGTVGLVLTQAFYLTGILQWGVRRWADLENQMTAAERILEYRTIDSEVKEGTRPSNWPSNGKVIFKDVSLRYSQNCERVLKDINFEIQPKQKIGIVGRTGAGKTSIISVLFRLYEFRGTISIDDVDINTVAVDVLRANISIIPQDPVLFNGNIRDNLDPYKQFVDKDLWDALQQVEMKEAITSLTYEITDGGSNFSIGQRQLLCLARALIRKNKILVLDEVNANMDRETDILIQETIKKRFSDCTVITIAHRINTVMDSDKIIVMDLGNVLEFNHPSVLLKDKNSHFYKIAKEAGLGNIIYENMKNKFTLPILRKGFKKELEENDIYEIMPDFCAHKLGNQFEALWNQEQEKSKSKLLYCFFKIFGIRYLAIGIIHAVAKMILMYSIVLQPILIGRIVAYFKPGQIEISEIDVWLYSLALAVSIFLLAFTIHLYMFEIEEIVLKMQAVLCNSIYRKCLKLSCTSSSEVTSGRVVTLMTKDVGAFYFGLNFIHQLWIGIVQSFILTYVMYREIGVAAIIGIFLLILFVPLQAFVSRLTSKYRLKTAAQTDKRISVTQEILTAIKVIKMYTWELFFYNTISKLRKKEMENLRALFYTKALLMSIGNISNRFGFYICVITYVALGNKVTAEKAFVALGYFITLRPAFVTFIPLGIAQIAEMRAALYRITQFLSLEEVQKQDNNDHSTINEVGNIFIKNVFVETSKNMKILENLNFSITQKLTLVMGPTGAGKSILLKLLLGDTLNTTGDVNVCGKVSYASQEPWLFPATIKQNIIFGEQFEEDRYNKVINVCALEKDLSSFPNGDKTVVIDKGLNLSKGQQARINLARAVYKKADIYLLDDCLASVDGRVANHIFNKCVLDFLSNCKCVLVTNDYNVMSLADDLIIINKGTLAFHGDSNEFKNCNDCNLLPLENLCKETYTNYNDTTEFDDIVSDLNDESSSLLTKSSTSLKLYKEFKKPGAVDFKVYYTYFTSGGGIAMLLLLTVLFTVGQAMASWTDYFVSFWVTSEEKLSEIRSANTTNSTEYQELEEGHSRIMTLYTVAIVLTVILTIIPVFTFYIFSSKTSINIHSLVIKKILNSPMTFFNVNLSGIILNRFSRDLEIIDEQIPSILLENIRNLFSILGILIVVASVNVYLLIPSIIFLLTLHYARLFYLPTGRSLKRLEAIVRSPVIGHLNATLNGITTIRASQAEGILKKEFEKHLDLYSSARHMNMFTSRAFGFYMDLIAGVYVVMIISVFLSFKWTLSAGDVGLAIIQAFTLMGLLQWGVRQFAELQNQIVSVERILEYKNVESEDMSGSKLNNWPEHGSISYKHVNLTYKTHGRRILNDLSFKIESKQKIGVVGRTGAGKTSIISTLFRLYYYDGSITIDDIDIKTISINYLRSKISISPQDPVLFSGTLRNNLDPYCKYSDKELWDALDEVEMKSLIKSLEMKICEGCSEFSVGQKQLLCLARAIVCKNSILVLDEATANIDSQTDTLIQKIIKKTFSNYRVITIAHKLQTVLDSDKIIVLDLGNIVQYGPPKLLLEDRSGLFYSMIKNSRLL